MLCSICLDNLGDNYFVTKCNHCYHKKCIKEWLIVKNNCPDCRSYIFNFEDLTNINCKSDLSCVCTARLLIFMYFKKYINNDSDDTFIVETVD